MGNQWGKNFEFISVDEIIQGGESLMAHLT